VEARATDSRKYVGWFHVIRGEAALGAGAGVSAVTEAEMALGIARAIGYPTLIWQAAHLLARAQAAAGRPAAGLAAATLAAETLQHMAAAAPTDGLQRALQQWPRVRAVHDTLDRLRASA